MIKKSNKSALNLLLAGTIIIGIPFMKVNSYGQTKETWPSFHGADRTNKSSETGFLKEWPSGGPAHAWTVTGLGEGYSSVSVADGMIFTEGQSGNKS